MILLIFFAHWRGAGVTSVQFYIETNPGWLELPLTGTNFHGTSMFEPLKFYGISKCFIIRHGGIMFLSFLCVCVCVCLLTIFLSAP